MYKHKKEEILLDTIRVINDRFAKVAATYTRGFCKVRYSGTTAKTDLQTIYLPASVENFSEEGTDRAWGYLNHEAGHIEVERCFKVDRKRRQKAKNSQAIFDEVPVELREFAIHPGSKVVLMSEACATFVKVARKIVDVATLVSWGYKKINATADQLHSIFNALEDPRMEAAVMRRWVGTRRHILAIREESHENLKEMVSDPKFSHCDGSFDFFLIGLVFAIEGSSFSYLGDKTKAAIAGVYDLLKMYKDEGDFITHHGFYDAFNMSLAIIGRIFRLSDPDEFSELPEEPEGGADEAYEDGDSSDEEKPEDDSPEESDGDEEADSEEEQFDDSADEDAQGEEEDDADGQGEEDADGQGEDTDEDVEEQGEAGEDCDESGDEAGEGDENSEEDENATEGADSDSNESESSDEDVHEEGSRDQSDDESESQNNDSKGSSSDDFKLEVGMIIRIKSTKKKARITKICADGSIEASEIK